MRRLIVIMFFNKIKILNFFYQPKICQEAFTAYYNRLPNSIEVEWQRDGKYIVGKINAGDKKFMTQAVSAREFVDMVNDALFVVYKIPAEYFKALNCKKFEPSAEQFAVLNNGAVKNSKIQFSKAVAGA